MPSKIPFLINSPLVPAKTNLFALLVFLCRLILIKTHTPPKGQTNFLSHTKEARKEPSTLTQRVGLWLRESAMFWFKQIFSSLCQKLFCVLYRDTVQYKMDTNLAARQEWTDRMLRVMCGLSVLSSS